MTATDDLLIEIGTEELPPGALRRLESALADGIRSGLDEAGLAYASLEAYATPRRLAVLVGGLALRQPDRETEQRGPPVRVAFDDDGAPTAAATAFAARCGVAVDELGRLETDKGKWLVHRAVEPGRSLDELLPGMLDAALESLPAPRRMRWGDGEAEFVRPVHWLVLLVGERVIDARVLGIRAGRTTRGHRFHAPEPIELERAGDYAQRLEADGKVVAGYDDRRERIAAGVEAVAAELGGSPVGGDALLDEVAALVEWPVPLAGAFDEAYLELPREVIVATLTSHQRYFPVEDESGTLLPAFVTVANLDSREPARVRDGNERVIRPRLADAAFFWKADRQKSLADRRASLGSVVYQQELGSLADKSRRVAALASAVAASIGADAAAAERAALLAKCDLVTGMVGEFPELQGTMGGYYAEADGEPAAVARAIAEQYLPRYAGDRLPETGVGQAVAIADKLDTLAGIFALGRKPSGNRDPFGLRRAALGLVRIILEGRLDVDLDGLVRSAVDGEPVAGDGDVAAEVFDFVVDRLRGYYLEQGEIGAEMFDAVRSRRPTSLLDFDRRLGAVAAFVKLDSAASLAQANKRIANMLRQAGGADADGLDPSLFAEDAEKALYGALESARGETDPLLAGRRYAEVLARLAELREPVDRFFDDVMVMDDDEALRRNRLALLAALRERFLDVADISRLSIARS